MLTANDAYLRICERQDAWWLRLDDLVRPRYGIGVRDLDAFGRHYQDPETLRKVVAALGDRQVSGFYGIVNGLHLARQILIYGKAEDIDVSRIGVMAH